jgi:hypothetical protein
VPRQGSNVEGQPQPFQLAEKRPDVLSRTPAVPRNDGGDTLENKIVRRKAPRNSLDLLFEMSVDVNETRSEHPTLRVNRLPRRLIG